MRSNDGRGFPWHKDIKIVYARVLLHPTPSGAPSRREPFDISVVIYEYNNKALWPSGKAKVCNTSIPGSIPGGASRTKQPNRVAFFVLEAPPKKRKGSASQRLSGNRFAYSPEERRGACSPAARARYIRRRAKFRVIGEVFTNVKVKLLCSEVYASHK